VLKRLRHRYDNLSIGAKLYVGFGTLVGLILVGVIISVAIRVLENDTADRLEDSRAKTSLVKDLQLEIQTVRYYEGQVSVAFLIQRDDLFSSSYDSAIEAIDNSLLIVQNLRAGADDADSAEETAHSAEMLDQVEAGLTEYRTIFSRLKNEQLVQRGDLDTGLAGNLMAALTAIDEYVDADDMISLTTVYIGRFDQTAATSMPFELAGLRSAIEQGTWPEAERDELMAQANTARTAMLTLLAADLQLIESFQALSTTSASADTTVRALYTMELTEQGKLQDEFDSLRATSRNAQYISGVLALALGMLLAYGIARSIREPIETLDYVANGIAAGQYDRRVNLSGHDEVGRLAQSFNAMAEAVQKRDTNLREQADSLRIATAKARESARLRSEFLSNMSHELRTPLNAIIGYSDMLLAGMGGDLNDKQHHRVERLRENGRRLLDLVNDVLDLARIEAKRVEVQHKPFSPRELVRRMHTQVDILSTQRGLDFEVVVEPNVPNTIIGDEKRIEQVALNLLSNAFKFTETGCIKLHVSADPDQQVWTLAVSDTGIGIPPHAMDIIFEEFRQVDGSSTRTYKGTGLGLAISRHLVHLMNGRIAVESQLGKGSLFTVTLPLVSRGPGISLSGDGKGARNGS
jgi:signal transduction histidine kinase